MSDTGEEEREWRFYLDDMIEFATKVQTYTDGLTQADFKSDGLTYDATLRNLELIGEAATHVPDRYAPPTLTFPGVCSSPHVTELSMPIWVLTTIRSGALFRTIYRH